MKMFRFMKFRTVLVFTLLTFLVGCSSSSENSEAPVIDGIDELENFDGQMVIENKAFSYEINITDDGGIAKIEWKQLSGSPVEIIGNLSFIAPEVDEHETLEFELTLTDNSGNIIRKTMSVRVISNVIVIENMVDQYVIETDEFNFELIANDPDSKTVVEKWTQVSGPAVEIADNLSFIAPEVLQDEVLVFEVIVTGATGNIARNTMKVHVAAIGNIETQHILEKRRFGYDYIEPNPDIKIVREVWRQVSGTPVKLEGKLIFTAPSLDHDEILVFEVTLTDSEGRIYRKRFEVLIKANVISITGLDDQNVIEREEFRFQFHAHDPEGDVYQKADGFEPTWRQISGTTAEANGFSRFIAPELTEDEVLVFEITVTSDSGNTATQRVNVNVSAYANVSDITFVDENLQACFTEAVAENVSLSVEEQNALDELEDLDNHDNDDGSESGEVPVTRWVDAGHVDVLDCEGYAIDDISGISQLMKLNSFYLGDGSEPKYPKEAEYSELSDISELAQLTDLKRLFLYYNDVTDISVLLSLDLLNNVRLKRMSPINLDVLTELDNLSFLQLDTVNIDDPSLLSELTGLQSLLLRRNGLNNLDDLSGLTQLVQLRVYDNKIPSFQPLEQLTLLNTLFLHNQYKEDKNNKEKVYPVFATDLSPLSAMGNMENLRLEGTSPFDFSVLSSFDKLSTLYLIGVPLAAPSFLQDLTTVRSLTLDNNKITELSAISDLTDMKELRIYNNAITTLQPLEKLTQIVTLKVNKVPVVNIDSLDNMSNLKTLKLFETGVTDISLLENLTELTGVSIGNNNVTDMSPLVDLEKLHTLAWIALPIDNLNILKEFKALKYLMFANEDEEGVDITPIKTLTGLERLKIELNDSFMCDELASLQQSLPNTEIETSEKLEVECTE